MREQGGPTQKAQLAAIRPMARRRPEAVRELEALQQDERKGAGEPELTVDDFLRLLREDVEMDLISARLESGGLEAQIQAIPADKRLEDERVAALLKAWQVNDPNQWSRFESPGIRCGLADVCGRIEASFARHNRADPLVRQPPPRSAVLNENSQLLIELLRYDLPPATTPPHL
jgi:hypothetical protein